MTHVAFLIPTLDRIGGAERQVILLAKGMIRRNWQVSVIALSGTGGDAACELTFAGASFLSLAMRKGLADPRGWFRFHHWLKAEKPDLVHAHLSHAAMLARWSRIAAPVRALVDTIHSTATGPLERRIGYRLSAWLPDKVTAVSRAAAEAWLSANLVVERKIAVIPNGVDIAQWKPDPAVRNKMRAELGLTDEFLWVAAGRLEPVKDYPTLLRAMTALPAPARLVIAGAGALEDELRRLSAELRLERSVLFLGFEPNVLPWMQAADGFVLASQYEGLPMGLLEAGACCLPAVATDVPGTREVIAHSQAELHAVPHSSGALAEAMTRLMQMPPNERCALGQLARHSVSERFSLRAVLDKWEDLYGNLLEMNPNPKRWGS